MPGIRHLLGSLAFYLPHDPRHLYLHSKKVQDIQAAGFHIAKIQEEAFQLRYVDGSALFSHVLTQVGFLDGWRQVIDPEDEEQVFALLETRLNQVAKARGELCMTVPMLYLEGEKLE